MYVRSVKFLGQRIIRLHLLYTWVHTLFAKAGNTTVTVVSYQPQQYIAKDHLFSSRPKGERTQAVISWANDFPHARRDHGNHGFRIFDGAVHGNRHCGLPSIRKLFQLALCWPIWCRFRHIESSKSKELHVQLSRSYECIMSHNRLQRGIGLVVQSN